MEILTNFKDGLYYVYFFTKEFNNNIDNKKMIKYNLLSYGEHNETPYILYNRIKYYTEYQENKKNNDGLDLLDHNIIKAIFEAVIN